MLSEASAPARPPPDDRPAEKSRQLVLALRVLLLGLAAVAVATAGAAAWQARAARAPAVRFTCPMHPEVSAATAGECPICHMALEPSGRATETKTASDPQTSADLVAVENVRKHKVVDFVRLHALPPSVREMRGHAWVEADGTVAAIFYVDQVAAMADGEAGEFVSAAEPAAKAGLHRASGPAEPWDASTVRVRFALDRDDANHPRPGQVGFVNLAPCRREVLGLPTTALLQAPEGPYVLAWVGDMRFEKRTIQIGETFLKQGFAVVVGGLAPQTRVVAKAAFFLDAERRLAELAGAEGQVLE